MGLLVGSYAVFLLCATTYLQRKIKHLNKHLLPPSCESIPQYPWQLSLKGMSLLEKNIVSM